MKKVRLLALVLAVAVMLTGAAYALWSQNITLTTSAAMGEMDVEVISNNPSVIPLSVMPGLPFGVPEDYMNPVTGSVASDNQSVSVTVGDMYPGAEYGLNFTIKNTGDVPFKLSDAIINCTDNWNLFNRLSGEFYFLYQSENFLPQTIHVPMTALSAPTFGSAIADACADVILYPGDELVGGILGQQDKENISMKVLVDETITGDQFENEETAFTIDFIWEQCDPTAL